MAVFMLVLFQIYSLLLIGFYSLVTGKNIQAGLEGMQRETAAQNGEIVAGIAERSDDMEAIESFLDHYAADNQMGIAMYDDVGRLVYEVSYRDGLFGYKAKDFVILKGRIQYALEMNYRINISSLREAGAFSSIRNFSLGLMGLMFLLLLYYFRRTVTVPIKQIHEQVSAVTGRGDAIRIPYEADDEIGDLCRTFEDMDKRLEQSYRDQTETIEAISHDLRTPLTSIFGYMERLRSGKDTDEDKRRRYYDVIFRKTQDIYALTEDLSRYDKNSDENLEPKIESIALAPFFESLSEYYEAELQAAQVDFYSKFEGFEEVVGAFDGDQLKRVLNNLVTNALKYGGRPLTVYFEAEKSDGKLHIRFWDTGQGIPEEAYAHVFDRFWRSEKSRSRDLGGTGLGLSICKNIVEANGGTIDAFPITPRGFGIRIEWVLASEKGIS